MVALMDAGVPAAAEPVLVDPLTGLLNHRGFQERLRAALRHARATGDDLSLAIVDVDVFGEVNEVAGHHIGDRVLTEIAARLTRATRFGDVLGRTGGDEFAIVLPGCRGQDAFAVVDRARAAVAAAPFTGGWRMTVSSGISDLLHAADAVDLIRLASGALYWSKGHGRDVASVYDAAAIPELSAGDRARRLERSHALLGIRALARAIDAKDPTTRQHSDRVAVLAAGLARTLGWTPEGIGAIEEAALVHDVGKIGVPDAVLFKDGRLDRDEYDQIKQHALRGAEIVVDILSPDQIGWIRGHHERPDGRGYPDGLCAEHIADGAAILAVADAFDVMTMARSYSRSKTVREALAECRALIGAQFMPEPVAALVDLVGRRPRAWEKLAAI